MNVVFRTDASLTIGTGHVMRCLTLAGALRECGATVSFVCREHKGHLCGLIGEQGFSLNRLPAPSADYQSEDTLAHADWLGARWQDDAESTRAIIDGLDARPDWLIVDHYAIDRRWESFLRAVVGRIMVIDDLADRAHDCDLLLDQNLVAKMHTRYVDKVPAECRLLLGLEYALLQPLYAELHNQAAPREGAIHRILIYFGGADSENLTGQTITAFLLLNRQDIEVDVVIGSNTPFAETIRQQVLGHRNIHLHNSLPTLAMLMINADLAVGAGGATSWERLCLGLPSLVVTLADNQRPIAEKLHQFGMIRWLGHRDTVDESKISLALGELIQQGLDREWSSCCLATVDGNGVNRVSAVLTANANTPLQVRSASLGDEEILLRWANDPVTRQNAFSTQPIPAATHKAWFRNRLCNKENCRLYIVETIDRVPLGQVRFERQNKAWEVHYVLAPVFRGRGLGHVMLKAALSKFRADIGDGTLIIGQVKITNPASQKIFQKLGFETRADEGGETVVYRRML